MESRYEDLTRIRKALEAAARVLGAFTPGAVAAKRKAGGSPVTEADHAVDRTLRKMLPGDGEGWLSEETVDDAVRLGRSRVWVVDPLDGTKEFVLGLPEWSVSIGLVEDGEPVAGGILNPATDQLLLGAPGLGVTLNGEPVSLSQRGDLEGALVLASRSEVDRGEWERFAGAPFTVKAMGSVAYKLACVAGGLADATWTLVPKNEWDVAAGVALVRAAGGEICTSGGERPRFNRADTLLPGLVATTPRLASQVLATLGIPEG